MRGFRGIVYVCVLLLLVVFTGCVHQWPEPNTTRVPVVLELKYTTNFTIWDHYYDPKTGQVWEITPENEEQTLSRVATSPVYDNALFFTKAKMRYIVRAFKDGDYHNFVDEFVFVRDVNSNFDCRMQIELIPGEYEIFVWSDLYENDESELFYDPTNFLSLLHVNSPYTANTEWRDAFRGTTDVEVSPYINDVGKTTVVQMRRPLAKFELITTDLTEFLNRETIRIQAQQQAGTHQAPVKAEANDYKVRIYYPGYLPSRYDVVNDKLVDSETGRYFTTVIEPLGEDDASIGFDYVLINDIDNAKVAIQVEVLTLADERVALSYMVSVPLKRDYHTILRSPFMTVESNGGVYIDPDFDGEFNIFM